MTDIPFGEVKPKVLQPIPTAATKGWIGQVIYAIDGKRYECTAKNGTVFTWTIRGYFAEQVRITDTTASTSATTGALIVAGGVGIAGGLYVAGVISVANSITCSQFRLSLSAAAPTSATATGGRGEIRFDASYIYVCVATNTWKRSPLTTW